MTIRRKFLLPLLLLLIFACSEDSGQQVNTSGKTLLKDVQQKKSILMFVDLTGSMEKTGVELVAKKAATILLSLAPGSQVNVKLIDDHADIHESLFLETIPVIEKNTGTSKMKYKKDVQLLSQELEMKINRRYKYRDSLDVLNSCVINTVPHAYRYFVRKGFGTYQKELVYLSDMIEMCDGEAGAIYMASSNGKSAVSSILNQIDKNFNADSLNLKSVIGNNVSVILTSSNSKGTSSYSSLKRDEIRKVWEEIFRRAGYEKKDIDEYFNFGTEIPVRFSIPYFERIGL